MLNILLLHRIITDYKYKKFMEIDKSIFKCLLSEIKSNKFNVFTLSELLKRPHLMQNNNIITLTFDDGWASDYDIVFPMLAENNISATFFISTKFVGRKGYITWSQIRELSDEGMEIGSHAHSHANLTYMKKRDAIKELILSKSMLEDRIGIRVKSFSFPGGYYNQKLIKLAKEIGYNIICASDPGINYRLTNLLKRNALNCFTNLKNLKKILFPSKLYLMHIKILNISKNLFIKFISEKKYIKLRDYILLR